MFTEQEQMRRVECGGKESWSRRMRAGRITRIPPTMLKRGTKRKNENLNENKRPR